MKELCNNKVQFTDRKETEIKQYSEDVLLTEEKGLEHEGLRFKIDKMIATTTFK